MAKRAQYTPYPRKTPDSPALWDWLATEHPETMAQFVVAFSHEIRRCTWELTPHCPKLREHIESRDLRNTNEPRRHNKEHYMMTKTIKLPKDHKNTFCGLTFICPICGSRDCTWRRLRRQGRTWIDEYYCTNTGQSLQAGDLLASLKEEHGEPLPAFIEFYLGE